MNLLLQWSEGRLNHNHRCGEEDETMLLLFWSVLSFTDAKKRIATKNCFERILRIVQA